MDEYRIPTVEGRELLLRPQLVAARPQLQLALISTYGNIMDAVTLEAGDAEALTRGAARVVRAAHDQYERDLAATGALARESYREAIARNPWLNGTRDRRALR